jgi:hypothetical protein
MFLASAGILITITGFLVGGFYASRIVTSDSNPDKKGYKADMRRFMLRAFGKKLADDFKEGRYLFGVLLVSVRAPVLSLCPAAADVRGCSWTCYWRAGLRSSRAWRSSCGASCSWACSRPPC